MNLLLIRFFKILDRKQLKSESCFGFFDYIVLNVKIFFIIFHKTFLSNANFVKKDLLNNYNLYNIEKDSFMLQFIIKKFEWL